MKIMYCVLNLNKFFKRGQDLKQNSMLNFKLGLHQILWDENCRRSQRQAAISSSFLSFVLFPQCFITPQFGSKRANTRNLFIGDTQNFPSFCFTFFTLVDFQVSLLLLIVSGICTNYHAMNTTTVIRRGNINIKNRGVGTGKASEARASPEIRAFTIEKF